MNIDLLLFNKINGYAGKFKWLDRLAVFCAKWLPYLMGAFLFLYAFAGKNAGLFLLPVLAGVFSRFIINEAIYFFYKRKRPVEVLPIKSLIEKPRYPAFPSGHASFFFAISCVLWHYSLAMGAVFLALSFIVSLARIFSGVHWPSDILAGIAAGGASAYLLILWIFSNLYF